MEWNTISTRLSCSKSSLHFHQLSLSRKQIIICSLHRGSPRSPDDHNALSELQRHPAIKPLRLTPGFLSAYANCQPGLVNWRRQCNTTEAFKIRHRPFQLCTTNQSLWLVRDIRKLSSFHQQARKMCMHAMHLLTLRRFGPPCGHQADSLALKTPICSLRVNSREEHI